MKFFKHARQRLLANNKFDKYLAYALGEIVIVILGILFAIRINNWNEQRKEEKLQKIYLKQLLLDLETDKAYYHSTIDLMEEEARKYNDYQSLFRTSKLAPTTIFSEFLKIELSTIRIHFESTTVDALISTGDIKILPENIRNKLNHYHALQNITKTVHAANMDGALDVLENLSMVITAKLYKNLENQQQLAEYLSIESNMPKAIIATDSYLQWKHNGEAKTIESFNTLISESDSLVSIINKELKD